MTKKTPTKKKAAKKAIPKRKPVVRRSNELTKTSTSVNSTYPSPPKDSKRTVAEIETNVEQPKEDIMPMHPAESQNHQTPGQETTFQNVLRKLCDASPAGDIFRNDVIHNNELDNYDLSAEQKLALVKVGHASGKYAFDPGIPGYCCCTG